LIADRQSQAFGIPPASPSRAAPQVKMKMKMPDTNLAFDSIHHMALGGN